MIAANQFGHLICTKGRWNAEDNLVPTGKIIVDLSNPESILKETGESGLIFITKRDSNRAIICSSPAEALALHCIPQHHEKSIFLAGTPGEKLKVTLAEITKRFGQKIELAENLSELGQRLSTWVRKNFAQISFLRMPEGFKSWVDYAQNVWGPTQSKVQKKSRSEAPTINEENEIS